MNLYLTRAGRLRRQDNTLRFETVYKTAVEDYPRVKGWILEHLDD